MAEIKKQHHCKCENCGNEADMVVTCTLPNEKTPDAKKTAESSQKVKGTAMCTHCGNEADMWVDL
jgi:hypothetical protein